MSDSDRRPELALVGAITAIVGAFLATWAAQALLEYRGEHREERERAAAYQAEDRQQGIPAHCALVSDPNTLHCVIDAPKSDQTSQYAHPDLRAQQEMAEWALAMVFLSIAGLGLTSAGIVYVALTLRAALEANRITREQFARENRAWLDVDIKFGEINYTRWGDKLDGAQIVAYVTARNVGKTPATSVHFDIPSETKRPFEGEASAAFRRRIAKHKNEPPSMTGDTVFPNGERTRSGRVAFQLGTPGMLFGDITIPIFVSYQSGDDPARHVTPIAMSVGYEPRDDGLGGAAGAAVWAEHHPLGIAPD